MIKTQSIIQSIKKIKLETIFIVLFAFFFNFPNALQSLIIGLSTLYVIVRYNGFIIKNLRYWAVLYSFYFMYLLSALWSDNYTNIWSLFQPNFILLFFHVVVYTIFVHSDIKKETFMVLFVLSVSLYFIRFYAVFIDQISYCQTDVLKTPPIKYQIAPIQYGDIISQIKELYYLKFINKNAWEFPYILYSCAEYYRPIEFFGHHTYLAIVGGISILFSMYLVFLRYNYAVKIALIINSIFLVSFIIIIDSPLNLLLICSIPLFIALQFKLVKLRQLLYLFFVVFIIAIIYRVEISAYCQNITLFQLAHNVNESNTLIDYTRAQIYKESFNVFKESNKWIGCGANSVFDLLNKKLQGINNLEIFSEAKKYNTHCDYSNLLLSGGFFNLFLFLAFIIYILKLGIDRCNYLFVFVIILFASNSLFENLLSRLWGAYFYAFFIAYFISIKPKE